MAGTGVGGLLLPPAAKRAVVAMASTPRALERPIRERYTGFFPSLNTFRRKDALEHDKYLYELSDTRSTAQTKLFLD